MQFSFHLVVAYVMLTPTISNATPIEVTYPKFNYKEIFPVVDARSLRNAEVHLFDERGRKEIGFRLHNSMAEVRKSGRVDQISLNQVIPLPSPSSSQSTAVFLAWTVIGGSSWSGCYVQVLVRNNAGQVAVGQQIHYGCRAPGTGAHYDKKTGTLTVKSGATDAADWDEKTRCVVDGFRWDGHAFVPVPKRRFGCRTRQGG